MAIRQWYGVGRPNAVLKYIADALCIVFEARTETMRELIEYRISWYKKAPACRLGRTKGPSQSIPTGSYTGCSEPQKLSFIDHVTLLMIAYLMIRSAAVPKENRSLLYTHNYPKKHPFLEMILIKLSKSIVPNG